MEARSKHSDSESAAGVTCDQKWVLERSTPFCSEITRVKTDRFHNALTSSEWIDLLTDRELENLSTKPAMHGIAELSQSEKREHGYNESGCPCIMPQGVYMHLEKLRLLHPLERMALQGITVPLDVYECFSSEFWNKLAGNSFCAGVMAVIMISLYIVLAKKHAAAAHVAPPNSSDDIPADGLDSSMMDSLMQDAMSSVDVGLEACSDLLAGLADSDLIFE